MNTTTALTAEQTAALDAALACYQHRINRLAEGMAVDNMYASYKTQQGKPTAEATRAAARVASASKSMDLLSAERKALAAAFGIKL